MKFKILIPIVLALAVASCNTNKENHNHNHEGEQNQENGPQHEHEGEHEHAKIQYTAYTNSFELFAEADVFVAGGRANILAHFSKLPSFKPLENGKVTVILSTNGREVKQTLENPTRIGIYSFNITPSSAGNGTLSFHVDTSVITITDVEVYANHSNAHEQSGYVEPSMVNKVFFTKEQSWKIDFRTEISREEPFGQVIKTAASIQAATGNEKVIPAKTTGIVLFSDFNLLEGNTVRNGQTLLKISSGGLSDNNISVRIAEAKNNFRNAEANYTRKKELAKEKIISERELLDAKNAYDNAKAVYENLVSNFNASGQRIKSPMEGFVKQVFVSEGQYVEAGQPLITVSQNQTLMLKALIQQQYAGILASVISANIKTLHDNKSYTLQELNGKVLSYGKSMSKGSYLLALNLQIDNKAGFIQGSLVEIYLKTLTNSKAVTVPNTALLEEQGIYFLFVQDTPELFEKREIKIGETDGIRTEVISGLRAGERIISKGAMLVKLAQTSGALDPHSGHVH